MLTDGRGQQRRKEIEDAWDVARDMECESAVLACCLLLGKTATKPALTDGDFCDPSHQTLWKAMKRIEKAKRPIDAVILAAELKDMGRWGYLDDGIEHVSAGAIAELFRMLPSAANVNHYAARVRELTSRRAALTRAETELKRARTRP